MQLKNSVHKKNISRLRVALRFREVALGLGLEVVYLDLEVSISIRNSCSRDSPMETANNRFLHESCDRLAVYYNKRRVLPCGRTL